MCYRPWTYRATLLPAAATVLLIIVAVLAVATVPATAAEDEIVERFTGVAFPKVRSLDDSHFSLAFTGRVRFTLFFLKFNACALAVYTEGPDDKFVQSPTLDQRRRIIRESEKKILVMHMVRNVDKDDMEEIFSEYLAGLPDDEDNAQDKRRLLKAMPETRNGDELDFVWSPESLAFLVGGVKKEEFKNPALAAALWSALLEA